MSHRHALPMPPLTGREPCTTTYGFFPDDYNPHSGEVVAATTMCRRCPAIRACFVWALTNPALSTDGIWGAATPWQRRELRKRLRHRLGSKTVRRTLDAEYAKAVAELPGPA
ncbi:WhiB family transcriptional regulator [Streptomyces sp. KM273126]|uniref:WhiB family transcriptional regulator n=1 Tax=Streptomyces sp. KM273126 TaxID=2545247 RepID=UPI00103FBDE3|nr:WhiB family transcriptional regulator [Streptomyces sp. KM273126]MBA2807173.1 WhiB family transcriptional regulator [Streptomyces sp. KM273126]